MRIAWVGGWGLGLGVVLASGLPACGTETLVEPVREWQAVTTGLPAALLSIGGTSSRDVWAVGADKGAGPLVVHFDGSTWSRVDTKQHGDLWWVHALPGGTTFMAGAGGAVVRSTDGKTFERMKTPGLARDTVYGVWAAAADDAWAVGGAAGHAGFVWHWNGTAWANVPLPASVPRLANGEVPGLFKVWGPSADDVWIVGGAGTLLHAGKDRTLEVVPTGLTDTLFTVHGTKDVVVAVGGGGNGVVVERHGQTFSPSTTLGPVPLVQGVCLDQKGDGWASGEKGQVYRREKGEWHRVEHGLAIDFQSLHASWIDPSGGFWSVGGNVLSPALDKGAIVHFGAPVAAAGPFPDAVPPTPPAVCPKEVVEIAKDKSVARQWNEQILAAIRRDLPRPGVHARNLYHLAAAMWDAWAAYDGTADGVFVNDKATAQDVAAARNEAISYAAYRVLHHRYAKAIGGPISDVCFGDVMKRLGYDATDTHTSGTDARAVGNRIGLAIIQANANDGANEDANYADPAGYKSPNPPLIVDEPSIKLVDPNVWQPLNLAVAATQNGIVLPAGVQGYIGSNWGGVTPFAMTRASASDPWHAPSIAPPVVGTEMKDWVVEVIRRSSELDPTSKATIDASPGAYGNNPLGTNDGKGHPTNPVTGQPYAPNPMPLADFGRTLAEFWADGPKSETPPGHWNVVANIEVTDAPGFERKLGGVGTALDPLEWDVKVYLALDGAVHDAAITAWDLKRRYESIRPISLIRWMGQNGQSSDPNAPHFHADGLPLIPGLVELVTAESAAPGQRHEHLRPYVGQIAILSWRGEPGDRKAEFGGVGWVRAVEWMPYQRRNFVTPAFPGFVSGHSTFSRAAAEALTDLTGSPYFPGGFAEAVIKPGYLSFEAGPSADVHLQWGSYYDAADQAGQSRIWGGIHIQPDDFEGRRLGSVVGKDAAARARKYFDGTAIP